MYCPNCTSKRVKEIDVGDVYLNGWNQPVQKIAHKCLRCGHIWRAVVPVGIEREGGGE